MTLLPERTIKIPAWLPQSRRRSLSDRRLTLLLPPGVRARLRTPERILPSDWNERFRVMPAAESFPGKWRRDIAPHAAWIMDLWALHSVRELWFCGPDQASKTSSMLGCIGWSIDQDPGNIFYTASNEDKTKEIVNDKLIGMLRESPRLKKRLSKRSDDTGMSKVRMNNGVTIRAAWSNSPASTASFSARYTFNDEVDKWQRVGKETSPIRRIQKRTKNYPLTYKHFWSSTPAGQYVHKGMLACQQIWTHAARCPDCNTLVVMDEEHMAIPDGATTESIKADPEAIGYACNACGSIWDEEKRLQAYRYGDKFCLKGADIANPIDIGVHLTGFVTPDMRLADIAVTILQARAGDIDALIDLAHGIKCIDYDRENTPIVTTEHLLQYRCELPRNLVPVDTWRLCLLVDTQQSSFYYQVWSYGYAPEIKLHMLRHGIVERFSDLEGLLKEEYVDASGTIHRINNGLIDSGGTRRGYQKHSRTVEVYEWCSRNKSMLPIKGMHGRTGDTITYKQIETFPGTNKKVPGGLKRANLRVDLFKDELERRLNIQPDDRGALSFHNCIDEPFAKHYTAEIKDDHGDWQHNRKHRNDYWDCTVYALALLEMMKLRIPKKDIPQQTSRIYTKGANRG